MRLEKCKTFTSLFDIILEITLAHLRTGVTGVLHLVKIIACKLGAWSLSVCVHLFPIVSTFVRFSLILSLIALLAVRVVCIG